MPNQKVSARGFISSIDLDNDIFPVVDISLGIDGDKKATFRQIYNAFKLSLFGVDCALLTGFPIPGEATLEEGRRARLRVSVTLLPEQFKEQWIYFRGDTDFNILGDSPGLHYNLDLAAWQLFVLTGADQELQSYQPSNLTLA